MAGGSKLPKVVYCRQQGVIGPRRTTGAAAPRPLPSHATVGSRAALPVAQGATTGYRWNCRLGSRTSWIGSERRCCPGNVWVGRPGMLAVVAGPRVYWIMATLDGLGRWASQRGLLTFD